MEKQRLQAYVNLIKQLLTCSSGEEVQIIESNRELVDAELLQVMAQVAEQLAANGDQNSADVLLHLRSDILAVISETPTSTNPSSQDYLKLFKQILQATGNSNGDPKVVYPLLEANLDKLDDNFIDILQRWTSAKLSEVEPKTAQDIANNIWYFSDLIQQFPLGNKANNIEIAIAGYEQVLNVFTRESNRESWAGTQNNLGNAYINRIRDNRALNLEKAIKAYEVALEVRTEEDCPIHWAMTQNNLGIAYCQRIHHDRSENVEKAIKAFRRALSVYTKENFPIHWAMTQNNRGTAYLYIIHGDRADNLEKAIKAFQLALKVRTQKDFPIHWATTQNNLGIAYRDRIRGHRALNLERAIKAFRLALKVRTKSDFPQDWADTQNNLGNAYRGRICGSRQENLEKSIEAFQLALSVCTKSDFPIDWAGTQNNLGNAYSQRIRGDKQENLKLAIEAYQGALEVYTPEADPINCLRTSRNLGHLHFGEGNWQTAIDAYQQGITAVEISRSWAINDQNRQQIMADAIEVYHKLVQAYINIEQKDKAIETVERSKARDLVQLLTNRDLYPKGNVPQGIITELNQLRRNIPSLEKQLQVVFDKLSGNSDDKQQQQRQSLEESRKRLQQELQQSRQQLDQVLKQINDNYDSSFSLTQTVETIPFRDIQSLIDQGTAIIEWYVTRDKILTFIVSSHKQQPIVVSSSAEKLERLEEWDKDYTNAYRNQKNQWITNLSTRLADLATILDINNIISEIDRIFENVGDKCDRLILVPHRFLHLFPLHALPLSKDNLLIDRFERGVSYAPSSQLLKLTKQQHRPDFNNLFAIQNPTRPEAKPLPGSKLEVDKIRQYFDPKHSIVLAEAEATEAKLNQNIKQLRSAHCVHFSCHGKFEPKSPLESALLLADADLTLYKIFKLDLNQCRIVGFSACETGMTLSSNEDEDTGLPSGLDEYIGLPSGFLYAGSPSVVSTLWKVDPLATALLLNLTTTFSLQQLLSKIALYIIFKAIRVEILIIFLPYSLLPTPYSLQTPSGHP
ncbi:MAG: CHAT domain-containing protein [Moorea sp. SIO1F2]|uniref:CHAT domain-containing protein n=1 Tax=Moorena sp. SIO1F2 TaxID=2607819 RepID=UPI0013B74932|nr:CHAT domain-containing tetratricopeptide repeat protein [Moorena sp. SIO1F2]NET82617.1 CHAT domain-containing protein [Moorena sp. SIO1F2]